MSKQKYNWKRFWCPRSSSLNLADVDYLYDPDTEWGKASNPDLVTLEAIADTSCLVLIGEPGIGKSQELERLRSYTEELIDEYDRVLQLDLEDCTEDKLYTNLFKSEVFIDWMNGTDRLYLFLDSLDQGWLTILKLPTLLVEEFSKLDEIPNKKDLKTSLLYFLIALKTGFPQKVSKIKERPNLSRLYLRIACRATVFSQAESSFSYLWGDNLGSYALTPLFLSDIKIALDTHGLNVEVCLKEIEHKGLIPLAIKPISLQFLLKKLQGNNGQLPDNQKLTDIYLDGCRELCRELKNDTRHPLKPASNLEVEQRLVIAARIAAITTFCLRSTVWIGQSLGDGDPDKDVLIREICGQSKNTDSEKEPLIEKCMVQEVLDTALFSLRVSNRMGWAHKTYAEFLAAWYLTHHEIPLAQITELIFLSEESAYKLIPQLHETAAWLASMRLDVLQEIIKTDPDVLLRSDVPTDANVRSSIVDNLLTQYEEGKIYDPGRDSYRNYAKLKHPELANQLRPYIRNFDKQINARDLAIDIAEACEVSELQKELADLALDASQSIYLRISAAKALCSIGDAGTRLKLKPLAIDHLPEDEGDRLKGYALQAIWSDHLTVEELFQALTPPKKKMFFGAYQMFLEYRIVPQLQPHDFVYALTWLETQGVRYFGHPFEKLGDAILLKAWEVFDLPGVAESFTKVSLVQWREHQSIISHDDKQRDQFASSLLSDSEKRHILVEQAVSIISETEENLSLLLSSSTENILVSEDVFWMIERLQSSDCKKVQRIWTQLIEWNFNRQDAKQIDAILVGSQINEVLQEFFVPYFQIIELDSTHADELKSEHLKRQEIQDNRQSPSLVDPPPNERVLQCLENLEAGDLSAWWQLNREMVLKSDSKYYNNELELDLTKLPGWKEAEETTQIRIIKGAKKYVQQQDNIDYEWIGTNTFDRPALAGCRSLQLLLKESPSFLDDLSSNIWKKWAPVIIAAPSSNQHEDSYLELIKFSYLTAPEESLNTLKILIDKENQEHDYLFVLSRFDKCWDERLKLTLLDKAKDPTLKPKYVGQLLEELLKQGSTEARDFAKSLIYFPLPLAENAREKALIATGVLVKNSDSSSWSFVWPLIQQDSSFGREVLELATDRYLHGLQLNLTEVQLADLYIWLVRQYPHNEDPDYSNEMMAHVVTAREEMASLRDNVLTQLKERGTRQACTEIQRLIQKLPDVTWLGKTLLVAQANMRRQIWQPPTPEYILQLLGGPKPSRSELYNQLNKIDLRTQKMADEPKVDQSIHITGSEISGTVNTGKIENKVDPSNEKKGFDWKFWLPLAVGLISVAANGIFNDEIKKFLLNRNMSPQIEQKLEK